mgnify:CR=1 FL=1
MKSDATVVYAKYRATGEIVGWLNVDEYYEPNVFGAVRSEITELRAERATGLTEEQAEKQGRMVEIARDDGTRPATDAGQHGHILPAVLLIGIDVADDAGRRLELVELLARLGIDRLEVTFERSVEHHAAGGSERT